MDKLQKVNVKNLISYREIQLNKENRKVCVYGQGFVGLPLTLSFAFRGCETIGVDVNENLVKDINNGVTYHTEKFNGITIQEILNEELNEKRYKATTDGNLAVRECNNIIITVGIPIKDGKYTMNYLESACTTIGRNLKRKDLVVIRSTVVPGITEEFIVPILERESKMKAGEDFYLAYSSERIAEGKAFDEFANMPTLVAGINEKSCERAVDLLKVVCKKEIIKASCIKAVETSKIFENVQRDVNIAMVQEFARFTEALGIDIFEVIKLANTHKRVNLLTPGPGVGGYCIPNAYHYIASKAEEMDVDMELSAISRRKNTEIPKFIVNKVQELLYEQFKSINGVKVAVLGLAMKDYSNDDRMSPAVDICQLLIERGAEVMAFDPVVVTEYDFKVNSKEEAFKGADVVLILTKQHEFMFNDYGSIIELMNTSPICIDTKSIIDKRKAENHGLKCWKI